MLVLRKPSRRSREPSLGSRALMIKLHLQKVAERRWKQVQDTREEYRNIACTCRDGVRPKLSYS